MSKIAANLEALEPARSGFIATPDDANELPHVSRTIIVGTAGDLKVRFFNGDVTTIPSAILEAMPELPIAVTHIYATGTAASDILVLY